MLWLNCCMGVACGAASHLRLKPGLTVGYLVLAGSRMWSGFSSEIETSHFLAGATPVFFVACGAASHLRLKPGTNVSYSCLSIGRMWSGFSSEIETSIGRV